VKELTGLIVLSMPILVVLCIGGLAGYAGWAAGRRVSHATKKLIVGTISALAVVLVFIWDEIAGRVYFSYLCSTKTAVNVFNRAELQPEYWENDTPRSRIVKGGSQFSIQIGDNFELDTHEQKNYSTVFRIDRDHLSIRDRASNKVLSEMDIFRYWGGWLARTISLDVTAIHCPIEPALSDLYRMTFVRNVL